MPLPKQYRLSLRYERDRFKNQGLVSHTKFFTIIQASSSSDIPLPRFGILLSKKTSPQAIKRNLIRRKTSAAIQPLLPQVTHADFLIIPKTSVAIIPVATLSDDLSLSLIKIPNKKAG